ncbi:APC family permease [Lentilactobacillus sp. IMAU92037]|uniref:APC family permease n=1 Tax=Lentilactobacillus TaxID=2767893 RepID=UPI001C2B83A2|nr:MULTISPECIES: APC family permease [Lentilactobacillus]MBV0930309.1 APC family permease [Lentilactobacillus dabitei]MDM7515343.1 APC family permease [Lentilactobacillus sp. TOM.63]
MDGSLKRNISFFGLVSLGAGGVIGSSWIYTNSQFFKVYGAGGEIFGLLVASALAVLVSLSFAELSTIFSRSGGEVVYGYAAFGKKGALFAGWALLGAYLSILAFFVTASSLLISTIFPQIAVGPYYTFAGVRVHLTELAIGVGFTLLIFLVNYLGARLTGYVQIILFLLLVGLGLSLVVVGFVRGRASNFMPAFSNGQNQVSSVFRFILPAMTFLTGWESVAVMAEETNIPRRRIGLVVVLSIVIAAIYYCSVLLSSAWVYPWEKTANMQMGTIDAFKAAGFPILSIFAYLISFLGLATSFLSLFAAAPRLIFALARGNILPKAFAKVHPKYGTPTNALWLVLALVLGVGWLGKGALVYFLDMGGFLIALAWSFSTFCLLKIRRKYPTLKGGFRNQHLIAPTIGGVVALGVALLTLIPGTPVSLVWPAEYVILAIWVVFGLASYLIKRKDKTVSSDFLGKHFESIIDEQIDDRKS